ncbi:DUF1460 domain-containing protein [Burkholderia multivorans]|uniref:DUF1460 domain-containing protein n=1 Tax=Burkholderia multivorans TaxID=87883 RepID=UPI000CFF0947|nr:DUF1460 domain-containing protein [Burkholderia multivorans]MBU9163752.1 DUF1460 domain-containing protein [Burkholderia multivorans]MBU9263394.1 DUF1460 domain-containing protein [Burkholderia multivorans]PRF71551.1 DUF1460 domain-containing protein [Burkholderia multivorans]
MKTRKTILILLLTALSACGGESSDSAQTDPNGFYRQGQLVTVKMDNTSADRLDMLLAERAAHPLDDAGQAIDRMSRALLGTPYRDGTLIGSPTVPEQLVVDLQGVDCFTFADYVEALRKSTTRMAFMLNLIDTRYVDGEVTYLRRKHFFTDWAYRPFRNVDDITARVSPRAVTVEKTLNRNSRGGSYVTGLPEMNRAISFIPAGFVDAYVVSQLKTGDFIGIYATADGLDVTHVGIFVATDRGPMLRNASSLDKNRKVVDSPFAEYVAKTPGIVVLRPKPISG